MKLLLTGITDIGRERDVNEDGFVLCPDITKADWSLTTTNGYVDLSEQGAVVAVADGMGGAEAGEVASAIALDTVKQCFATPLSQLSQQPPTFFQSLVTQANETINRHVDTAPETSGMGTTLVVAWLVNNPAAPTVTAHVAWCGDSRGYRFRPGKGLERVTHDHSYVQQLIDSGELTEEEALTHPESNLITRCLGDTGTSAIADAVDIDLQPGDLLLICSDGLCGYCADSDIEQIVARYHDDPAVCQEALLQAALDAGGYDNITIAIAAIQPSNATANRSPFATLQAWLRRLFG
ncbi:MAG: serine/threonine-protein phosphatase [Prevotella sp.]|nr:serine/threonine-protein phosphatase [Prevotella sp.]